MPSSFATVLSSFPVDRTFWTDLIGCTERQLNDWWLERRAIPRSVTDLLSKTIGLSPKVLTDPARDIEADRVLAPLWLKARESQLGDVEHRAIAATRLLAARYDEVRSLVEAESPSPKWLFGEIREAVDPQQPARAQGRIGAQALLRASTLEKGATGIGEVIRGFFRAHGVVVLETPINSKKLEGFCVPVAADSGARPCVVANSYRTTWFRRNYILLHELAHAVFDLEGASAIFDERFGAPNTDLSDIAEQRADAFALHALVPKRLLTAIKNRGIRWEQLNEVELASVVAETHAEQGLLVRALQEHGLITSDVAQRLAGLKIARELRRITFHARGLAELSPDKVIYPEVLTWGNRLTTFPLSGVRLPIPFVRLVLQALEEEKISPSKAAELLMIQRDELSHYGVVIQDSEVDAVAS